MVVQVLAATAGGQGIMKWVKSRLFQTVLSHEDLLHARISCKYSSCDKLRGSSSNFALLVTTKPNLRVPLRTD